MGGKAWPEQTSIIATRLLAERATTEFSDVMQHTTNKAADLLTASQAVQIRASGQQSQEENPAKAIDQSQLVGIWRYQHQSGKRGKYLIVQKGSKMYFKEGSGATSVQGKLLPDGQWLVARLQLADGKDVGSVRLMYKNGVAVSNFKTLGQ